jgi:hypothetical protein
VKHLFKNEIKHLLSGGTIRGLNINSFMFFLDSLSGKHALKTIFIVFQNNKKTTRFLGLKHGKTNTRRKRLLELRSRVLVFAYQVKKLSKKKQLIKKLF